ncbi:hypothetical protein [Streptomyces roseus]|uniref:Uncharacterized protein n=1 Tax=Streptomyces roseus TaxID=66430 RepID=A0A0J7AFW1_9ACTN|nr:hypothetical protein [Streptomyces roseus]KMO96056.1 hypothetical protein ACS04_20450 [Streptomyces roseus]
MSETTPDAKGPAPVQYKPAATEPTLIPAEKVNPEDIGTLSLRYTDGQPVIVVKGGKYIPVSLSVANEGNHVASYRARSELEALEAYLLPPQGLFAESEVSDLYLLQPDFLDLPPEATGRALIPADKVSSEDIGALSLRYVDDQPVIVVSGGKYIPASLPFVNDSGASPETYAAQRSLSHDKMFLEMVSEVDLTSSMQYRLHLSGTAS